MDTLIRFGKKRFYDHNKFPRGFAKSGDFTLLEEDLLVSYGETLLALENGELTPDNAEEKHFVKVVAHPNKAKSKIEHTWLKYINLARGRRRFHTLNSKGKVQTPQTDMYEAEYDIELD